MHISGFCNEVSEPKRNLSNVNRSSVQKTVLLIKSIVLLPFRIIKYIIHQTLQLKYKLTRQKIKPENKTTKEFFVRTSDVKTSDFKTKITDALKLSKDLAVKNKEIIIKVALVGIAITGLITLGRYTVQEKVCENIPQPSERLCLPTLFDQITFEKLPPIFGNSTVNATKIFNFKDSLYNSSIDGALYIGLGTLLGLVTLAVVSPIFKKAGNFAVNLYE